MATPTVDRISAPPPRSGSRPDAAPIVVAVDDRRSTTAAAQVLRLRDERPIEIRGAAMAARLLNDRGSPLHRDDAEELQGALRAAHAALDAADPAPRSLPAAA